MPRKKTDPLLIALMDQQQKVAGEFERWYTRCKRAFTRMDKIKKKLVRLGKRIQDRLAASQGAGE